jgi:hypothetical protein
MPFTDLIRAILLFVLIEFAPGRQFETQEMDLAVNTLIFLVWYHFKFLVLASVIYQLYDDH